MIMKRYHNGRSKTGGRYKHSQRGKCPDSRSPNNIPCTPRGCVSPTTNNFDDKNDEVDRLYDLLYEFCVDPDVVADIRALGYGSIYDVMQMSPDVAKAYFGNQSKDIWNACVSYVQCYRIRMENMDAALREPRKYEITMDDPLWSKFLKGGFRAREFVLVAGESGLGKTLLMITLALRAAAMGVHVYYLDTEHKVDADRVLELCRNLNFKTESLKNFERINSRCYGEQVAAILHINDLVRSTPIDSVSLIIVDTLTGPVRRELPGESRIGQRQEIIAKCVDCMKKMSTDCDREVIVAATTDVACAIKSSNSNAYGLAPLGGCILQHSATTRIFLNYDNEIGENVMTLQSSLRAPQNRVSYKISKEGIVLLDVVNEKCRKVKE